MIDESVFGDDVDQLLEDVEQRLEDSGVDIDTECVSGILTLEFENGSKVIINRQTPLRQIWVAAKSGGFHFSFDALQNRWIEENSKDELFQALSRCCSEQSGENVSLVR